MLNIKLWNSFEYEFSTIDMESIESRLRFLRDIIEAAIRQYQIEDIRSELDLDLHVYLSYHKLDNGNVSPWLIHDTWFSSYGDGTGLNPELAAVLKSAFFYSNSDLYLGLTHFLNCLNCEKMIEKEVDAVVWLSFLDYMASQFIYLMGRERMRNVLQITQSN
jgi:hypothetical protein